MLSKAQRLVHIPKATSSFLDALRITAAMIVFVMHCFILWYDLPATAFGHDMVIVFFVLSGYVIAYSTFSKYRSIKDYAIARLARLYSVVIPALLLTFALHFIASKYHPALHDTFDRGNNSLRYILAAFFLQEAWKWSASPPTNGPLWSLGYEFWYYALFGAAVLITARRSKFAVISLMLVIVGPKILLLMPVWLLGVALFTYGRKIVLNTVWAQLGFTFSTLALITAFLYLPAYPYVNGQPPLFWAGSFVSDWAVGCLVALVIWTFHQAFSQRPVPGVLEVGLRWGAGHTFSLYLYHFPLLVFALAILPLNYHNPFHVTAIVTGILGIVLLLSTFTEAKRNLWYNTFSKFWDSLAGLNRRSPAHPDCPDISFKQSPVESKSKSDKLINR